VVGLVNQSVVFLIFDEVSAESLQQATLRASSTQTVVAEACVKTEKGDGALDRHSGGSVNCNWKQYSNAV